MKYIIILLAIIASIKLEAQEKLNKLSVPTSPAASVLGVQPQAILAPKSYQALETALYSNFLNDEGSLVLPDNFALEFTPYWTKNHGLSLDEYLYPKSGFDQFIRNSSFSVASTQSLQLGDSSSSSAIGFGYRTAFYFGNKKDRQVVYDFKAQLLTSNWIKASISTDAELIIQRADVLKNTDFFDIIQGYVIKAIMDSKMFQTLKQAQELTDKIIEEGALLAPFNKDTPDVFLDGFYNLIDKHLDTQQLFDEFKPYIRQRNGLTIDVAYACFLNFPTNDFNFSVLPRQSVWVTPSYRFKDNWGFLKLMAVMRMEFYNLDYYKKYFPQDVIYRSNFDYGGAVAFEFRMFSLQLEAVGRFSQSEISEGFDDEGNALYSKEQESDFQYIGTFSCNLSDGIVISYSLGNRFNPIQEAENTLVSLLSLNFGFGSPTQKDLDLSK